MIDIRGNFFYTRTVPCQLWFFDRAKEKDQARRDHVLMAKMDCGVTGKTLAISA
jgi:hypothetical protein